MKKKEHPNFNAFKKGMRDGLPIGMGYFAVAFTLGIAARNAGLTAFQGFLASILNNASAGEYAGFTIISADAAYWEIAAVTLVANARYLLMSCSLSQKFKPGAPIIHRFLVGYAVTDELFGITIAQPGCLNPYYSYGAFCIAIPCWATGTALGVLAGNLLPLRVMSALSVALFGMFIAVIIPPARKERPVLLAVSVSFLLSFAVSRISLFSKISDGIRTIILTLLIATLAAVIFPVKEESNLEA